MKVARAGDLPRRNGSVMFFDGGSGMSFPRMAPMPPMPAMPAMPLMPSRIRADEWPMEGVHFEIGPQIEAGLRGAAIELERVRPQIDRIMMDLPRALENVRIPRIQVDVDMHEDAAREQVRSIKPASAATVRTVSM
jgi:hypothetical protein